jgi:hypothetical protein
LRPGFCSNAFLFVLLKYKSLSEDKTAHGRIAVGIIVHPQKKTGTSRGSEREQIRASGKRRLSPLKGGKISD